MKSLPAGRDDSQCGHSGPRLLRAAGWLVLSQTACVLALLVGTRLTTELVPPAVFGQFSLCLAVALLFRNSCSIPLSQAIGRFYPEAVLSGDTASLKRVVDRCQRCVQVGLVSLTGVAAGICLLVKPAVALCTLLVAGLVMVFIRRDIATSFLNAARRHRPFGLWDAVEAWARPLLVIVFVLLLGARLETVLFGHLAAVGITLAVFSRVLSRPVDDRTGPEEDDALAGRVMKYFLPIVPLPFLGWISGLGDRYVIGWVVGFHEVGLYAAVYGLVSQPFLMASRVAQLTFCPVYFRAIASGESAAAAKILRQWFAVTAAVNLVGVLLVALLRNPLGSWLLAESYHGGTRLMLWIATGSAALALARVFESRLYALKRTRRILAGRLCGAAAVVLITPLLVWAYGVWGAALACTCYYAVQCAATALLALRVDGIAGDPEVDRPASSVSEQLRRAA